jgi:hypothetical protein
LLVNVGLNDGGIGVVIDSVYATDGRVGVPRILSARAVLNARVIGDPGLRAEAARRRIRLPGGG